MKENIFAYLDYKAYSLDRIKSSENRGRGLKSRLAQFINCDSGFISKVLKGNSNFNLEQACLVNEFLCHAKTESHYYILLIQWQRSGSQALKDYYIEQIRDLQKKDLDLSKKIGKHKSLSNIQQSEYYSQWMYTAVHTALSIPGLSNLASLSEYLGLHQRKVTEVLHFLANIGLCRKNGTNFELTKTNFHLSSKSKDIVKHHGHWRLRAMNALDHPRDIDLHYSSVVSLSKKDSLKIRRLLEGTIASSRTIIEASNEEELLCLNLDFFSIKSQLAK